MATVNPPAQKQSEETTCASEFPPTQPSAPPGAAAAVEQIGESSFENPQVASALSTNQADNNNLEKIGQETDSKRRANGLKKPEYYAKLGIDSELLGMHIVRGERTTGNKEISKIQFQCTVNPLEGDILDMYSYHRGREGMEPRDCDSGELLCPLEPTDTNYDLDAPKLVATVVIEFPLEDGGESSKTAGEMESIDKAVYKQTLQWDLSDPCTPSPLAFANDVANEYGLSFGQRMDLAVSIEQQIELHLQQNCNFRAPLTSKDPLGNERRFAGSTIYTHRYDQVLQTSEGGIRQQRKQNSRQSRAPTESSRQRANQSTGGGSANSRRGSLGRVTYEKVVVGEPEEEVEPEYIEETKRRTRAASVLDVGRKCKNGSIGAMEKHSDFHCHICHKRCKVTYSFACGAANHAYCAMHCKVRIELRCSFN